MSLPTSKDAFIHSITLFLGTVDHKCEQYWPKRVGESKTFEQIEVHNVEEEDFVPGQVIKRDLNLKGSVFNHKNPDFIQIVSLR